MKLIDLPSPRPQVTAQMERWDFETSQLASGISIQRHRSVRTTYYYVPPAPPLSLKNLINTVGWSLLPSLALHPLVNPVSITIS